ncbi:phosphoadenosine phosphosulfate reductase domain-containing protein, partial [Kaarinaea lacus]
MRAVEKLLATKRLLTHLSRDFAPVAFFQSFSVEDMVLADVIYADLVHREYSNIKMFTIDTGKLPDESHQLIRQIRERYGDVLKVYYPDANALEQFDDLFGFHDDYHHRSSKVRLLEPLQRALFECDAWITSSDAINEPTINSRSWISWDNEHQIPRFNPLSRWTRDEILSYSKHHNLPAHSYLKSDRQPQTLEAGLWWWQP